MTHPVNIQTHPGGADRRLHIMQVTFGMVIGGLERVVMELCRHVDPSSYRLSICCIGQRGPLADVMEAEGVKVIVCQNQTRTAKYLRGLELARLFRNHEVDLIHSHHAGARRQHRRRGLTRRPLVHTDRGCIRRPGDGGCSTNSVTVHRESRRGVRCSS